MHETTRALLAMTKEMDGRENPFPDWWVLFRAWHDAGYPDVEQEGGPVAAVKAEAVKRLFTLKKNLSYLNYDAFNPGNED